MLKTNRREVTAKLLTAVTFYFVKKMYSVHREVGVERWGARRLDVLCMDYRTNTVAVEIKSCLADFRTDKKWRNYLKGPVNQMYFCFPQSVIESRKFSEIKDELKSEGVGILALGANGRIRVMQNAKKRQASVIAKYQLFTKLAWRAGDSKRNVKRTYAV